MDLNFLDDIAYLAQRIEDGDDFEQDVRSFISITKQAKTYLLAYIDDREIRGMLRRLQPIDLRPHRRSFLESILPKGQRDMVGTYAIRTKIRKQVAEIARSFDKIGFMLGHEGKDYV